MMERIEPDSFSGPRAYFTDFDYKIVQFKHNKEAYRREIERKLKIIFLTKNTVVCAASHLTHKFAYELFKDNPILLNNGMIIPALRDDKEHAIDYLNEKKIKKSSKENMVAFYRENVNRVVSWELMDNSLWFKENLAKELKNENSVIRRNLPNISKETLSFIISKIENQQVLSREFIIETISILPKYEQRVLLNFTNLIYHMSGARVVNCESALPQENYIDYSLADISGRKVILSETQIFWKIFLELAFETMLRKNIPIELLDILTFEDIYYLRKPIEKSSFRMKYDDLIKKSTLVIEKNNPDDILFDINELLKIKDNISESFKEIFELELPEILRKKHVEHTKELRKSSLSIGIGLAGFIPGISNIANLLGFRFSSPEFFINLNQTFKSSREIDNYDLYIKNKEQILHKMIEKSSFSNKSELFEVVNLIVRSISSKLML